MIETSTKRRLSALAALLPLGIGLLAFAGCSGTTPDDDDATTVGDADHDGYTTAQDDCDDNDAAVYPGATEACDNVDNDCNGTVDDDIPVWHPDQDGDGHGVATGAVEACSKPANYASSDDDCDDANPDVSPDATEICNGIDDDCGGDIDEGFPPIVLFPDADGDGYGVGESSFLGCAGLTGYALIGGDCDDTDPAIHGGAAERCDGKDNDCDGAIDDNLRYTYFKDADLDGYGSEPLVDCNPPSGYVASRGDCNDAEPAIHPGAADLAGDKRDADCGGSDAPEPHVLLSPTSFPIIKLAIQAAKEGTTIWVGPAMYIDGDLNFGGRNIKLMSTQLEDSTFINSQGLSHTFSLTNGETSDAVIDGFSIYGGVASSGGAFFLSHSSPTIRNVVVHDNEAERGGAFYLESSNATISHFSVYNNLATDTGGGFYLYSSNPKLTYGLIYGNSIDLSVAGNGGGGGLAIVNSNPVITNCTIVNNRAAYGGGASVEIDDLVARPGFTNSILAYNFPDNLFAGEFAEPTLTYSDLFNVIGTNHNLASLASSNLTIDPELVTFSNDGDPNNDDFHLAPDSPLIDAGSAAIKDPDGSKSDLGAFGGTDAVRTYYTDHDLDGLFDGWEVAQGLNITVDDSSLDPDLDGLSNLEELSNRTDPNEADMDGDGTNDKDELTAGSSPDDWYSRPGTVGGIVVKIPDDLDTIQEAIDRIAWRGQIEVASGTYIENLKIDHRDVSLHGLGAPDTTVITGTDDSVLQAHSSIVDLKHFTVTDGRGITGGGILLSGSSGLLQDLVLSNNNASSNGGGLALLHSSPAVKDLELTGNSAQNNGGGVYLSASAAVLEHLTVASNVADMGGGVSVFYSSPMFSDFNITGNVATNGGGVHLAGTDATLTDGVVAKNRGTHGAGVMASSGGSPSIVNTVISQNSMTGEGSGGGLYVGDYASPILENTSIWGHTVVGDGGGIFVDYADLVMNNSAVWNNSVTGSGGGIALQNSTYELTNVILAANKATLKGGATSALYSSGQIFNCALVNNSAASGGGSFISGAYAGGTVIRSSILAYNVPDNLKDDDVYKSADGQSSLPGYTALTYSDLYNTTGPGHNLLTLDSTNLTSAPQLLAGVPAGTTLPDGHLALASPLVNNGDRDTADVDGSRADIGAFGGPGGGDWDLDGDGVYDYFWPGTLDNAPGGYDGSSYDCDDQDAAVTTCP